LVKAGSTKEECCDRGPLGSSASTAWNEEDMTPSSLFYMHVQGGVACSRCKGMDIMKTNRYDMQRNSLSEIPVNSKIPTLEQKKLETLEYDCCMNNKCLKIYL